MPKKRKKEEIKQELRKKSQEKEKFIKNPKQIRRKVKEDLKK